jgi:putative transposase
MPRRARIAIAGFPHHIIQRGHCRNPVFFCDSDRVDYLGTLAECRAMFELRIYAYCLMGNHVHLLVDPGNEPRKLSLMMKRLAGRHSRRLNAYRGWSGSLWEGRFKCSPVDSDRYLLICGRYIDLNPVRVNLVDRPEAYVWSSYRARAGLTSSPFLDIDPALAALAAQDQRRHEIYRELANVPLTAAELELVRGAVKRNQLTGDTEFIETVRDEKGLDVPARSRGRPRSGFG